MHINKSANIAAVSFISRSKSITRKLHHFMLGLYKIIIGHVEMIIFRPVAEHLDKISLSLCGSITFSLCFR